MREHRAKAICSECPVLAQCREHALQVGEVYGIWGGMGESERAAAVVRLSREKLARTPRRLAS